MPEKEKAGNDILTHGFTEKELEYQAILEAQLLHTSKMIRGMIPDHRHYTDDCGDYLWAALALSEQFIEWRMEGIDQFVISMDRRKEGGADWLGDNFAADGIAPEVIKFFGGLGADA